MNITDILKYQCKKTLAKVRDPVPCKYDIPSVHTDQKRDTIQNFQKQTEKQFKLEFYN